MNQDDPFSNFLDNDKTVLKPSPGRRNQQAVSSSPASAQNTGDDSHFSPSEAPSLSTQQLNLHSDNNVLVGCALPLLSLATQLRNSASHSDIPGLRASVINEIKTFDTKARQSGCPAEQVQAARYALCVLLDEVVLNTPWGCNSIWSTQGMLITFHKESWGGEKFFQVLNNIISQPGTYFNLLELFYYCVSLGFEGKYKIQEQGQNSLYDIRENLYQVLQRQKGDFEQDLSIHWRGISDKRHALARYIPLWVVAAVTAAVLALIFIGFLYLINLDSGSEIGQQYQVRDELSIKPAVIAKQQSVSIPEEKEVHVTTIIEKVRQFLAPDIVQEKVEVIEKDGLLREKIRQFMAPEIAQKKVEIVEKDGLTIIRILEKNFFASGSDKIQSEYLPLIEKISQALEIVNGQITVVGHTDNEPIFTVRFPSNWVLSQARAEAVANVFLKNDHHQDNVVAEGRADTQNLVPNDTAEHRAMNRRVEINF